MALMTHLSSGSLPGRRNLFAVAVALALGANDEVAAQTTSSVSMTHHVARVCPLPGRADSVAALIDFDLVFVDRSSQTLTGRADLGLVHDARRVFHDVVPYDDSTLLAVTSRSYLLDDGLEADSLFLTEVVHGALRGERLLSARGTFAANIAADDVGGIGITAFYATDELALGARRYGESFVTADLTTYALSTPTASIDSFTAGDLPFPQSAVLHDLALEMRPDGRLDLHDGQRTHYAIRPAVQTTAGGAAIDGLISYLSVGDSLYFVDGYWAPGGPHIVNQETRESFPLPRPLSGGDALYMPHYAASPDGQFVAYGRGDTAYRWRWGDTVATALPWYDAPHQRLRFVASSSGDVELLLTTAYEHVDLTFPRGGTGTFGNTLYALSRASFLIRGADLGSLYAPRGRRTLSLEIDDHSSSAFGEQRDPPWYRHTFDFALAASPTADRPLGTAIGGGRGDGAADGTYQRVREPRTDRAAPLIAEDSAEQLTVGDSLALDAFLLHDDYFPPAEYATGRVRRRDRGTATALRPLPVANLRVIPNPASGLVHVRADASLDLGAFSWQVLDASGRRIAATLDTARRDRIIIDVSRLRSGLYVLVGVHPGGYVRERILVR